MNTRYRYFAFTAIFSVFFCISVSLGAIKTSGVEIVVDKDVLDSSDFAVIDDFVADGLNETMTGKIIWVSPKAEFTPKTILTPNTRTSLVYAVKVSITNDNGILKHGMPVVVNM